LVGACSYLLIGFDTHNPKAARAATQAFWVNRVADVALIAALGLLWAQYQSLSFSTLLASGQPAPSVWVGALLLVGAMGKSAQIPFQGWLPDAMTGPTPVSALIHAATMVAAGVFLLVRAYPLLAPPVLLAATVVGVLTAVVGSVLALRQWELKRVLAFSTVAQLGYMVAAVGLGAPHLALLHLLTHAAFKAGLFLVAGSVQHAVHVAADGLGVSHAEGDLRALGGLWRQLPITFAVASVAIAALVGLPLTAGFLSKDAILLQALWVAPAAGALLVFAAALTAYYSLRWLAMVFLGPPRMPKPLAAQVREASGWQRAPLVLLGVASLALLYVPLAGLVGLRPPAMAEGHALVLEGWLWATLGFGQLVAALLVYRAYRTGALWQGAGLVFELGFPTLYRWLFGAISGLSRLAGGVERYVVGGLLAVVQRVVVGFRPLHAELSLRTLADGIDRRVVDPAVNALAEGLLRSGRRLGVLQRGRVQRYLAYTLVGLVLVVALVLGWRSGQSFAPLLPN
ncbi:MAG: proton-conducting transporter membrane subunit, partial [Bacteroidia bacterium]|nr:proton-conducting transporter membrane subunit [Bacteroidia bacterium]